MKKVIIIGGGIGGLSLAVALKRIGIPARVFERAPALHEIGAGISLWPNAMQALRRIGLEQKVRDAGAHGFAGDILTWRGRRLANSSPDHALQERIGVLGIHRADLLRILLEALGKDLVRFGSECTGFTQEEGEVSAEFADGHVEKGQILIGADGIHSAIREGLFGKEKARYSGYLAWRGIADHFDERLISGHGIFALGPGSQFGAIHIGGGRTYWFGTINAPENTPTPETGIKAEVLDQFRGWTEPTEALIGATDEESILRNDIIDRPPSKSWGEGSVMLLGDAAHATTPNLGQGGCQALEDAIVLAHCLKDQEDATAAVRSFEALRKKRTAMITKRSWNLGRVLQWENGVLRWARDLAIQCTPRKKQLRDLLSIVEVELPEI